MKLLNELKTQADRNSEKMDRKFMKRIDELEDKVDGAKIEAKEKEKREEERIKKIQDRLDKMELSLDKTKNKCSQREKETKEQGERTRAFKEAVGLSTEENKEDKGEERRERTWSELVKENKDIEKQKKTKEREEKEKHWKTKVTVKQKTDKKAKDIENMEKEIEEEKKKKDLKMGDSSPLHSESDWSWEEGEEEGWEDTKDKKENERRKKIHRYRKRKILEERTARKGKHMIGLGPVRRQSIGYFNDATADYEYAKVLAVNEFLMEYFQIPEEQMNEFEIVDTMIAKKEEDLIYVTFRDHDSIREIQKRAAELQNEEVMVRNFIPPQFWDRFSFLNKYCMNLRQLDKDIKYQIRFNDRDLEVLLKNRRTDESYYILPLSDIEKEGEIPKFNHKIVWTKRNDKPLREALKPVRTKVIPPSIRGAELQRQSSQSSHYSEASETGNPKKKAKKDSDTDVETRMDSSSGSGIESL